MQTLEIAYVKSNQKQNFYFYNIKIIQANIYYSLKQGKKFVYSLGVRNTGNKHCASTVMYTGFGMEHWANETEIMKWYMRKNRD